MIQKVANKKSIFFDNLLVAIIGLCVLLIIDNVLTPIEGPMAISGILALVYIAYQGAKFLLFKNKN